MCSPTWSASWKSCPLGDRKAKHLDYADDRFGKVAEIAPSPDIAVIPVLRSVFSMHYGILTLSLALQRIRHLPSMADLQKGPSPLTERTCFLQSKV